jgi:hypothetical protein
MPCGRPRFPASTPSGGGEGVCASCAGPCFVVVVALPCLCYIVSSVGGGGSEGAREDMSK